MRVLAVMLVAAAGYARAQDIASLANSPDQLAAYVNTHEEIDFQALWTALGIKDQNIFLPACDQAPGFRCYAAELLDVKELGQQIVILKQPSSSFEVFLRYANTSSKWSLIGAYRPNVKYFALRYRLSHIGSIPYFVFTEQGAAGTGLSTTVESWLDLTKNGFEPAFSYTAEGDSEPDAGGVAREFSSAITATEAGPPATVSFRYTVTFRTYGGEEWVIGKRTDRVVLRRNASGNFEIDPRLSSISSDDLARFYEYDERVPISKTDFLRFNFASLSMIASGKDTGPRKWLARYLAGAPASKQAAELKSMFKTR